MARSISQAESLEMGMNQHAEVSTVSGEIIGCAIASHTISPLRLGNRTGDFVTNVLRCSSTAIPARENAPQVENM
ncbi:MAG TPA: hypothetical protein VFV38_31150 [Ktedonobacteraceae bacterium]|nr:hypothetical protein [Ktedonobacteraceae bacterium]